MINFIINFFLEETPNISFLKKLFLVIRFYYISIVVDCAHTNLEILIIARSILNLPPTVNGCIVEAGAYKGGATAKLSLVAKIVGRKLVVFDSFEGIPENKEIHSYRKYVKNFFIFGKGEYRGSLTEVKRNVYKYGSSEVCIYQKGLFEKTMQKFNDNIALVFLDVDLASSTRTCLKYLYPLIFPGGVLYSHDGHLALVTQVFADRIFWKKKVGFPKPNIYGLGKQKLLKIVKAISAIKDLDR